MTEQIQNWIQSLSAWGLTPTEIINLATSLYVAIDLLWKGQKSLLRKHIEEQAIKLADAAITNTERLQKTIDFLQEKFKLLNLIPDKFLIDFINEVYTTRVKPNLKLEREQAVELIVKEIAKDEAEAENKNG